MLWISVAGSSALITFPFSAAAQVPPKEQAEAQLEQMTPAQIDARIKEMGMTREQAEARAKEMGVDLGKFLRTGGLTPQAVPGQVTPSPAPATSEGGKPAVEGEAAATDGAGPKQTDVALGEAEEPRGPAGLPYFGYSLFRRVPAAFEPTAAGPVDPEYLIGAGDFLLVSVWGQVEQRNELEVDKEGRIFIPTVGPVLISGQTLEQARKTIIRQMSQSFKGLVESPPTIFLDLTISRLRPKRVYIMGEVRSPGGYTVSSYANVFSSLFAIGGPTVNGSLREVRVTRNNRVVAKVDLYDYLTGADKTDDIRIQTNDIIYVPVRGKTVAIRGAVGRPAVYELKGDEQLRTLLDFAGGASSSAYLERVQIERIVPFKDRTRGALERQVVDVDFRSILNDKKDVPLVDGDVVSLYSILDQSANQVTISGAVMRPGTFQWEKVRTLRDLVTAADSLAPDAYLDRAEVLRTRPDQTLEALNVNLRNAMSGAPADNVVLRPLDQVRVYSKYDLFDRRFVTISGHVKNPGRVPYADSLSLFDLVFMAGGLQDSLFRARTYLQRADLLRLDPDGLSKRTIPFDLGALLDGKPGVDRLLMPDDEVIVYELDVAMVRDRYVTVMGSVRRPGRFPLTSNMTLADAILRAGGYEEEAWTLQAEVARVERTGMGEDSLAYIRFSRLPDLLDEGFVRGTMTDEGRRAHFPLQHRDMVFVRPNPEYKEQVLVRISGEVNFPGAYALKVRDERLSSLVKRAGSVTREGFLGGGSIHRGPARVNVDFLEALSNPGGKYDVILQPGDSVYIPRKPNAVVVRGEVNNPGILGFIRGDDMRDYIDRAGGLTDSASYALLAYPNGNVQKHGLGWFAGNPTVEDGSVITVTKVAPPKEGDEFDLSGTIKDVFAVLASAVTIMVLASRLN
jgi:protein involved in polysaccharide export with SLBB domain